MNYEPKIHSFSKNSKFSPYNHSADNVWQILSRLKARFRWTLPPASTLLCLWNSQIWYDIASLPTIHNIRNTIHNYGWQISLETSAKEILVATLHSLGSLAFLNKLRSLVSQQIDLELWPSQMFRTAVLSLISLATIIRKAITNLLCWGLISRFCAIFCLYFQEF